LNYTDFAIGLAAVVQRGSGTITTALMDVAVRKHMKRFTLALVVVSCHYKWDEGEGMESNTIAGDADPRHDRQRRRTIDDDVPSDSAESVNSSAIKSGIRRAAPSKLPSL